MSSEPETLEQLVAWLEVEYALLDAAVKKVEAVLIDYEQERDECYEELIASRAELLKTQEL